MEGPISKLAEFKKKNHCYNKYDFQCWSFENMGQIGVDLSSSQIFFWFYFYWLSHSLSKLGIILENEMFQKFKYQTNVNNNKKVWMKKSQKDLIG